MARAIWRGSISFGLVHVPVELFSGEKRADLHFNLIDSRDQARVRYERVNEETGAEVPWDAIVRGFEYDGGNYVLLSDEDFKKAAVENTQTVEIEAFVPREEIAVPYFEKPYYLVPGNKGEKGYVLLREALERSGRVGIARVVIHTRQHLAVLLPLGNALALDLLRFEQELRRPEEFDLPAGSLDDYQISKRELDMAMTLIESMEEAWDPSQYHDTYREKLMEWIERRRAEQEGEPHPSRGRKKQEEPAAGAAVVDMMDLLKQSVARSGKASKKEAAKASKAGKSTKPAPRRKRAAG